MLPPFSVLATLLLALFLMPAAAAAEAAIVVDNTAPAASSKGSWSHSSMTPGYHGEGYQFRAAGSGSNTFFWPFGGPEGEYEVSVRWTSGPNRATDASYVVKHLSGESTAAVNQQAVGGAWHKIGTFKLRPGVGHGVLLSDKANGVVVADAVMFSSSSLNAAEVKPAAPATAASTPTVSPAPASKPTPPAAPQPGSPPSLPQPSPVATPRADDPRYFTQTRYAIAEDRFWDYFQKRGGIGTFGYPVSNTFVLFGLKTQIFQRQIMQLQPDGGVALMNLLDSGLMPYTRINNSTFPGSDPEVLKLHPKLSDPDYHAKAFEFIKELAPDAWQNLPVNFYQTFSNAVRFEDAYPSGEGDRNLMPGFNLEIWGLPTSKPTQDPANKGFVYLRFQRGIMHYDDGCKCTQALLLADYLKNMMLGRNVPPDLLAQAKGSRFLEQYNAQRPQGLNRPQELVGSELRGAFRKDPTVTVDAGHGGREIGSSYEFSDGTRSLEKDINLRVARKVAEGLRQAGLYVIETRSADTGVNIAQLDLTGDGKVTISDDLQARVDLTNNANSDLLLSIHFNGVSDPARRGTYVFYNASRPFSDRSKAFAEMAQRQLVKLLKDAGYPTSDNGIRTDQSVLGGSFHFYLLGPQGEIIKRESRMPAALGEALFLTNPEDAGALRQDKILDAIAQAYVDAVREYFARFEVN